MAIFGDSKGKKNGINKKVLKKIMRRIKELEPQPLHLITLGDCIAGSSDAGILQSQLEDFKELVSCYYPFENLLPTIGNHEVNGKPENDNAEKIVRGIYSGLQPDGELAGFNGTVYYKDIGSSRLIFLNSFHFGELKRISRCQLDWFRCIAGTEKEHKLVFLHSPAYPTGAHLHTCLDSYPEERDLFWKAVDECGIDIVFAGHEHNYSRRVIDGSFSNEGSGFNNSVVQIISGGGGERLRDSYSSKKGVVVSPKAEHHYVVVDIIGERIKIEAVSIEGRVMDRFVI